MGEPRLLAGRRALITGSTGGLGFALASRLAEAGADIILHGLEPSEEIADRAAGLAVLHDVAVDYINADLTRVEEVERLVLEAERGPGGVDILVNNAVVRHFRPIDQLQPGEWDAGLALNLSAPFHAIRLLLPGMRDRGFGRIFNMTSVYGSRGTRDRVGYVTTKAAIEGLTRAVAMETLDHDISCHALCPGSVLTPGTETRIIELMARDGLTRKGAEAIFLDGKQPTGRFVPAAAVARLLVLLCGPTGREMTGAVLPIDGGWLASD
jgi:3-hydroxybutyrate dehydrogenase